MQSRVISKLACSVTTARMQPSLKVMWEHMQASCSAGIFTPYKMDPANQQTMLSEIYANFFLQAAAASAGAQSNSAYCGRHVTGCLLAPLVTWCGC